MKPMIYAMRFRGTATPDEDKEGVLKASTTAPSCGITTRVGPASVEGRLEEVSGEAARFESVVTFTGEGEFVESGTISFGDANRLHFSTVGKGHLDGCADPSLKHGVVSWRIDEGEGQFEGASGLITSNFFVSDAGEVTDHHFGSIFLA